MIKEVIQQIFGLMLCIILSVGLCIAEPLPCVDTLAGAKYGQELRHIPLDVGVRGFAKNEFGDWFPVFKKEIERGRRWVSVNLTWRDNHTFTKQDLEFAKKEIRRYQSHCKQYVGKVEVTPFTEHNLKQPQLDNWLSQVQKEAPDCTIINNPWKGDYSNKFKSEVHGTHAAPKGRYNYSYDGTNSVDDDVKAMMQKHKNADVFCVWHPRLNLRWRDKDTANRDQRNKEYKERSPDKNMLESLVYLFSNKGTFNIPKKWLIKSHSEKHSANDLKGDKLLIISPIKAAAIELKRAGKLVAKLPLYGSFDGGGWRYYWSNFGYQAGSELDVFIGKKNYGKINGGFRGNTFR